MMDNVFFLSSLARGEFFKNKTTRAAQSVALQAAIGANAKAPLVGTGGAGFRMSYHKPIGSVVGYVVTGYYEKGKLIRATIGLMGTVLGQLMPEVQRAKITAVQARASTAARNRFVLKTVKKGVK